MIKKLYVRIGNYIYTVKTFQVPSLQGVEYMASFVNDEIDSFTQTRPITKADVIEYFKEEYPERFNM